MYINHDFIPVADYGNWLDISLKQLVCSPEYNEENRTFKIKHKSMGNIKIPTQSEILDALNGGLIQDIKEKAEQLQNAINKYMSAHDNSDIEVTTINLEHTVYPLRKIKHIKLELKESKKIL